jgi:hypothetical protein
VIPFNTDTTGAAAKKSKTKEFDRPKAKDKESIKV